MIIMLVHFVAAILVIAALSILAGCTGQQAASLMPMGMSTASQAVNLYMNQERMNQQMALQRQYLQR